MLSRALSLATVMLLIGCFAAIPVQAQNLEAGKSPSQIFAGTCAACHKSPRGLLKTVPAGSLPGFLRQHYTTSGDMASLLSGFLVSNGAADTRHVGTQSKPGNDAKSEDRPDQLDRFGRRLRPPAPLSQEASRPGAEPQQAARPDTDGVSPQAEPGRQGRNAKRLARPGEVPDAAKPAVDGQAPAQAESERGPDGRKLTAKQRQRLSKRGKPGGEEPPKAEAAKTDGAKTEAAKTDAAKTDAAKDEAAPVKDDTPEGETAKDEGAKPEGTKPSGEGKSEATRIDAPKETGSGETPALRADPVPAVTPAPSDSPSASAAISGGTSEPASAPAASPAPAAVAASAPPPPPPVAPAGPPAPPISQ
jgi:hypothetical protein